MQLIRDLAELRDARDGWRAEGLRVALVPTMGALHEGHLTLVREARRLVDRVVVSLFVNPRQFGAGEDLARYPRRENEDAALLAEAGCDLLWAPSAATMYPAGFATTIAVAGVSAPLEGLARPGHFDGVATVVAKLFNQVRPDVALFGEKDYQQLCVVRRMVTDLDLAIEIVGVAIVRDDHGLALSSRNAYLSPDELIRARTLRRALGEAAAIIERGGAIAGAIADARAALAGAGFAPIDYLELRDAATLAPVELLAAPARLLVAARIGGARLIDNLAIEPSSTPD